MDGMLIIILHMKCLKKKILFMLGLFQEKLYKGGGGDGRHIK